MCVFIGNVRLSDRWTPASNICRPSRLQTKDIIHSEKSGICSDGNRKLGFTCWLYKSRWSANVRCRYWTCYIINFLKCFGWLSPDYSAKRKYYAIFPVYSSSFFHCHLTGFLKDTSLHLCCSVSSFLILLLFSLHFRSPFFSNFYKKKLFTLKHIFLWICNIFVQITPRKSSSIALESTSINFIFFRTYYLFNQFIKNRQENFCNRKCYIPTAKDDNSNYER
jgi:hypothetical protein